MPRRVCLLAAAGALLVLAAGCSSGPSARDAASSARTAPAPVTSTSAVGPAVAPARTSTPTRTSMPTRRHRASTSPPTRSAPSTTRPRDTAALPLSATTGRARQVITVVAASAASTSATLQAWHRTAGGWVRNGPAVHAWLGTAGMTRSPSESKSATPIGSFTLTSAFGHDPDPGTSLPYTRTTPDDWWISQPGPLYNTRQRCASGCAFTRGSPNEHLYYETPAYDHAIVIDYNTADAPGGVRQGAGSAFFLHQSEGRPTQGCVSIDAARLDAIMRWLDPGDHPRILIGTR